MTSHKAQLADMLSAARERVNFHATALANAKAYHKALTAAHEASEPLKATIRAKGKPSWLDHDNAQALADDTVTS